MLTKEHCVQITGSREKTPLLLKQCLETKRHVQQPNHTTFNRKEQSCVLEITTLTARILNRQVVG